MIDQTICNNESAKRNRIINVHQHHDNIFVEAGAGAGKTTLIVSRILEQLKDDLDPGEIVVITFTNAAAEELRERIIQNVDQAVQSCSDPAMKSKLEDKFQRLDQMNISTIHSFCYLMLKERSLDVGLPLNLELKEEQEAKKLKQRIFRKWAETFLNEQRWSELEELYPEKQISRRAIYHHICHVFEEISDLPMDTKFPNDIETDAKKRESELQQPAEQLEKAFWQMYMTEIQALAGKVRKNKKVKASGDFYADDQWIDKVSKYQDMITVKNDAPFKKIIAEKNKDNSIQFLSKLYEWITDTEKKKSLNLAYYYKKNAGNWLNESIYGSQNYQADIKESIKNCLNWFDDSQDPERRETLEKIEEYCKARNQMKNLLYRSKVLVRAIDARDYYRANIPKNVTTNDLLLQSACELICGKHDDQEGLQARQFFAGKFRCIYVDEFQDTDHVQTELIWRLAAEPEDKNKLRDGALFVVGDPKQSIYRFRGAEPELYFDMKARMAEPERTNTQVYELNSNFRSSEYLINWVNGTYQKMELVTDASGSQQTYHDMTSTKPVPNPVPSRYLLNGIYYYSTPNKPRSLGIEEMDVAKDAQETAALIEDLVTMDFFLLDMKKGTSGNQGQIPVRSLLYRDFLVLCSRTKDMKVYIEEMNRRGIPVQVMGKMNLNGEEELCAFIRIYRFLANPRSYQSRVGALEVLETQNSVCDKGAKEPGRESVQDRADQILDQLMKKTKDMSAFGLAEWLYHHPEYYFQRGEETELDPYRTRASLAKLQQMLESVMADGFADRVRAADAMEDYWNRLIERELPLEDDANAVRLMNVHKAKGLEGEIVIWMNRVSRGKKNKTFRIGKNYYADECTYVFRSDVVDSVKKADAMEQSRLEYVAATRAKQAFIMMDPRLQNCEGLMFYDELNDKYNFDRENGQSDLRNLKQRLEELKAVNCMDGCGMQNAAASVHRAAYQPGKDVLDDPESLIKKSEAFDKKKSPSNYEKNIGNGSHKEEVSKVQKNDAADTTKSDVIGCQREKHTDPWRPSGNVLGTIMHRSLELLIERHYKARKCQNVGYEEIRDFCIRQALSENEQDIRSKEEVDRVFHFLCKVLDAFADWVNNDTFAEEFRKAVKEGRVLTELPFSLYMKEEENDENTVWMNGSADLVVSWRDGEKSYMTIFDYKSDNDIYYEENEFVERLKIKYSGQLDMYRRSLSRLYDIPEGQIAAKILSFTRRQSPEAAVDLTKLTEASPVYVRCTEVYSMERLKANGESSIREEMTEPVESPAKIVSDEDIEGVLTGVYKGQDPAMSAGRSKYVTVGGKCYKLYVSSRTTEPPFRALPRSIYDQIKSAPGSAGGALEGVLFLWYFIWKDRSYCAWYQFDYQSDIQKYWRADRKNGSLVRYLMEPDRIEEKNGVPHVTMGGGISAWHVLCKR